MKLPSNSQMLTSWGRYLYWADLRQRDWEKFMTESDGKRDIVPGWLGTSCYWGASLYVVIEGWEAAEFKDPVIEALLGLSNYRDVLRRLRNFAFHYQAELLSPKFTDFFRSPDALLWLHFLHEEFCRWLRDYVEAVETAGLFSPEQSTEWRESVVYLVGWLPQRFGEEQLTRVQKSRESFESKLAATESDSEMHKKGRAIVDSYSQAARTIAAGVRGYRRSQLAKLGLNPDDYIPLEN
jgi:hypothetical protein